MRGRGKTNYLKGRIYEGKVTPLYVIDIRDEWKHIPAFRDLNSFIYYLMRRENFDIKQSEFSLEGQYRFNFQRKTEYERLFHLMCGFKNCTIIIDEADALFSDRKFERGLTDVMLGSRNNRANLIFAGKRPFLIPIVVRSQVDKFIVFQIEEQRDIDYITKRVRSTIPKDPYNLVQGEAIIFETGEKPVIQKFPKFVGER